MNHSRLLIIGSGPAGYTAGIYAGRANLSPTLLEGLQPGGQLTTTTEVENFPGFPDGVDANELMDYMRRQAERFGTQILPNVATKVDLDVRPFKVTLDDGNVWTADSLIIATGASAKYLGLSDEQKFMGRGVSACATCDGFFYRKKVVAVVGGGDTACEEASYLAGLASKVYLIVRKPFLRASKIMQERVFNNEKIEVLFETNTLGLYGENGVEGAHLVFRKGESDKGSTTFLSMVSSLRLGITQIVNSSLLGSRQTRMASSRQKAIRLGQMFLASMQLEMLPIRITAKQLWLLQVEQKLPWKQKSI